MKEFEKDYAAYEDIKADYDNAELDKDELGMEKARADYKAWAEGIEAKGEEYARIFKLYKDERTVGNSRIDLSQPSDTRDVKGLIETFRKFGITEFTFSSGWSSAIEDSWEFIQNGCELAGMVEINTNCKEWMSDEYEKAPAYLFRIA